MASIRHTSTGCIVCSVKKPLKVDLIERGNYRRFVCPECGTTIAEGAIGKHGSTVEGGRIPPSACRGIEVPDSTTWNTWEVWWTDRATACAIHGRTVSGTERLMDFVDKLYNIYDS